MRRLAMLTGSAILAAIGFGASLQPHTQGPSAVPPKAVPASTVDELIGSFFKAMTGPPGVGHDWEGLRSLFADDGRMIAARTNDAGGSDPVVLKVDDFIETSREYLDGAGLVESEISRRVEQFGNLAHVLSTYQSKRRVSDAEPYARGIYSFQLIDTGDGWRIVSLFWEFERLGTPIPSKYLSSP